MEGQIYLPDSYSRSNNHPAIFLIDFVDTHFANVTDEYPTLIEAAKQIPGLNAVVVSLKEHLNIDAKPSDIQTYYDLFKDLAAYVEANYTSNTTRTFVGRGSEGGLVMAWMFLDDPATSLFDNFIATDSPSSFNSHIVGIINSRPFPPDVGGKRLHFSFSASNNRSSCIGLINAINDADFSWLQFASEDRFDDRYETLYQKTFLAGLNFVYDNVSTGVNTGPGIPENFHLGQNYPNPFNPVTTITYDLPATSEVRVEVIDITGREVATLVNGETRSAGHHTVQFDAKDLTSGTYLIRMEVGGFVATQQVMLLK